MHVSNGPDGAQSSFTDLCNRHYRFLAALVLTLAAFNLSFRVHREIVTEWDESLYATTAAETLEHGNWIGTTFLGELDYYNTKPPLNVWLISASFKAFGPNLVSLRLPSLIAAWLTVLVLLVWSRRTFGSATALCAAAVLSTTFGFIYVHSARNANTDALFTLLMTLVAITLWVAADHRWRLLWLGPLVAALFLLRGMGAIMPIVLIGAVQVLDWRRVRERAAPLLVAAALTALPVTAWAVARWHVDQWRFIERMFYQNFVAISTRAVEGHTGTPLYYLNVLQKDQYDWLLAATAALVLFPFSREDVRGMFGEAPRGRYLQIVTGAWIGTTLLIPTLMRTKLAWYLNPFFPIFALIVGAALAHGFAGRGVALVRRKRVLAAFAVLALAVAETKLLWYSYNRRDLRYSAQGLILEEKERLAGRRVYRDRWSRAGRFVLTHVVGGEALEAEDEEDFLEKGAKGDYILLSSSQIAYSNLSCIRTNRRFALCEYPDEGSEPPVGAPPRSRPAIPPIR